MKQHQHQHWLITIWNHLSLYNRPGWMSEFFLFLFAFNALFLLSIYMHVHCTICIQIVWYNTYIHYNIYYLLLDSLQWSYISLFFLFSIAIVWLLLFLLICCVSGLSVFSSMLQCRWELIAYLAYRCAHKFDDQCTKSPNVILCNR